MNFCTFRVSRSSEILVILTIFLQADDLITSDRTVSPMDEFKDLDYGETVKSF